MKPTPANPENVPLDKIPAGWRLIYEEEYGKPVPIRLWNAISNQNMFGKVIESGTTTCDRFTYITTDLPDNGQPWHAHKPGDPAPVAKCVKVDAVARNGWVWNGAEWGGSDPDSDLAVIFYRLHDPAPKHPSTFEAHGHWRYESSKPHDPTISDRILDLLIVAGHVTAQRVEQARKLAQM